MKQAFLAAVLIIIASPALAAYGVGDTVLDFTLDDAFGNPVTLYDYQGMAVLVNFWSTG